MAQNLLASLMGGGMPGQQDNMKPIRTGFQPVSMQELEDERRQALESGDAERAANLFRMLLHRQEDTPLTSAEQPGAQAQQDEVPQNIGGSMNPYNAILQALSGR
jgi:hypothetical protein